MNKRWREDSAVEPTKYILEVDFYGIGYEEILSFEYDKEYKTYFYSCDLSGEEDGMIDATDDEDMKYCCEDIIKEYFNGKIQEYQELLERFEEE